MGGMASEKTIVSKFLALRGCETDFASLSSYRGPFLLKTMILIVNIAIVAI